jgi:hypothetical protein
MLPRLLAAALTLGIRPGPRSLRALLAACDDLDARAGLGPLAFAAAPAAPIGGKSLESALAEARAALAEQGAGGDAGGGARAWQPGGVAERAAAGVMRALAFELAFGDNGGGGGGGGGGGSGAHVVARSAGVEQQGGSEAATASIPFVA